jgi:hypothetical protein
MNFVCIIPYLTPVFDLFPGEIFTALSLSLCFLRVSELSVHRFRTGAQVKSNKNPLVLKALSAINIFFFKNTHLGLMNIKI